MKEKEQFVDCTKCGSYDKEGNYCLNGYKLYPEECRDLI